MTKPNEKSTRIDLESVDWPVEFEIAENKRRGDEQTIMKRPAAIIAYRRRRGRV